MKNQRGSAIVMLFIAAALFGALAYAFLQGSRTSTGVLTDEQAKSYAQQIISYANEVRNVTKRLQLRGCKDNQISYISAGVSYAINPNAPANKSCDIFESYGGGLRFARPSDTVFMSTSLNMGPSMFKVNNVGVNTRSELIWSFWNLKKDICIKLNDILGISNPSGNPPVDNMVAAQWDVDWTNGIDDALAIGVGDEAPQISGKLSFCYEQTPGLYEYVQVLLPR